MKSKRMMIRAILSRLVSVLLLMAFGACGEPPPKNSDSNDDNTNNNNPSNNRCLAIATCQQGESEVDTCDGVSDCQTRKECGTVAYCVPDSNDDNTNNNPSNNRCLAIATCQQGESEVDTCDGVPDCQTRTECGTVAYCVPASIDPTSYNQSCSFADECGLIAAGDPCECHICPDAAINKDALDEYGADSAAANCRTVDCPAVECADEILAICDAGTCRTHIAKYASTDGYDNSCETPADCAIVHEGEICDECQCGNATINVGELERYSEQFDAGCQGTSPCPCAQPMVDCIDGVCVFGG